MSIKIHHGPNGSYKTSGAIQDDAVPALREGRTIITNVRGFTLERAYEVFPDLPPTADIVNLDLENLADLERMRTWFQWAPRGAFLIFDETQLVFPKSWREKDLERFDFPGGPEAAQAADRPMGWLDAWTRHRHFNWDVVLTTPNIGYIRDDIRMTSEMAYKHSNLAVIGIPGRYKEAQHDAQLNRPPADGTIIEYKRIRKQTFALYQSTATGKTQDTKAGKSLFRSPKLVFLLAVLAVTVGMLVYNGGLRVIGGGSHASKPADAPGAHAQAAAAPGQGRPVASQTPAAAPVSVPGTHVFGQPGAPAASVIEHPFQGRTIAVMGRLNGAKGVLYMFSITDADGRRLTLNSWQMEESGYRVRKRSECVAELFYGKYHETVVCAGTLPSTAGVAAGTQRQVVQAAAPVAAQQPLESQVTIVADSEYSSRPWRK
ncbi:zonular occludens toxin domain-containing protein [Pseudomonas nitroreducens]|uniref:zonular occludens toxin domain-containing protein n=2 Tax=Gammaproteobacteria TaxID=1236 RepID=UPI003D29695E